MIYKKWNGDGGYIPQWPGGFDEEEKEEEFFTEEEFELEE